VVCVSRTNIDIDDEPVADAMRTYRFAAKREAVNLAP
jgi:Arc/MetJ family transcription regulator